MAKIRILGDLPWLDDGGKPGAAVIDGEHKENYVPFPFMEGAMVKAVIQEAAALASLALFVSMIAVWSQVLGSL